MLVLMSSDPRERHGERLERAPVRAFIAKQRLTRRALTAILDGAPRAGEDLPRGETGTV
jgi:hypothetical protein